MPVVPFNPNRQSVVAGSGPTPQIDEADPWMLMAAAQMHSEGRLLQQQTRTQDGSAADRNE